MRTPVLSPRWTMPDTTQEHAQDVQRALARACDSPGRSYICGYWWTDEFIAMRLPWAWPRIQTYWRGREERFTEGDDVPTFSTLDLIADIAKDEGEPATIWRAESLYSLDTQRHGTSGLRLWGVVRRDGRWFGIQRRYVKAIQHYANADAWAISRDQHGRPCAVALHRGVVVALVMPCECMGKLWHDPDERLCKVMGAKHGS